MKPPALESMGSAPASVANLGPGFDVFACALDRPRDTVRLRRTARSGLRLVEIIGDGGRLPRQISKNVASAVISRMARQVGLRGGLEIRLTKGLPLQSGLGSSAASAVAAAAAANALFGRPFSPQELLGFARYGEKVACGTAHPDNVAAALFGGFVIVLDQDQGRVMRLQPPAGLHLAVVHPDFALPTRRARAVLPKQVSLAGLSRQAAAAAGLAVALASGNIEQFGRAVMDDRVVEPVRGPLIPGFAQVKAAALAAGATGVAISGAGPSMFAVAKSAAAAQRAGRAMVAAWGHQGLSADLLVSRLAEAGAWSAVTARQPL